MFETELNQQDAYRAVFSFQQTLDQLNAADVANLEKAKSNVADFVKEILDRLQADDGDSEEDDETSSVAGAA